MQRKEARTSGPGLPGLLRWRASVDLLIGIKTIQVVSSFVVIVKPHSQAAPQRHPTRLFLLFEVGISDNWEKECQVLMVM